MNTRKPRIVQKISRSEFERIKSKKSDKDSQGAGVLLGFGLVLFAFFILLMIDYKFEQVTRAYMPETQPLTLEDIPTESEGYFTLVENPKFELFMTSYNAEVGQTDSTPCIAGGTGYNICHMARNGLRPIALSQELIDWSVSVKSRPDAFSKGDIVIMESDLKDSRCEGEFIVADAMNVRYRNRGDLFFLDRKDNVNCKVTIKLKL